MNKNLSICVVTKNNQDSIRDCLDSIKDLSSEVLIMDTGSKDETLKIIKEYGYKIIPKNSESNKDNKNYLINKIKNNFIFFIEPNEKIINGKNEFNNLDQNNNYSVLLLQNNILSKNIRIFNKNKNILFENPIYETIYSDSIKSGVVLKQILDLEIENEYKRLINWCNEERLNSQPIYYECCYYIKNKEYNKFFSTAEKYFFLEKNTDIPSYLMTKYYLSLIYFYIKKDFKNSIENLAFCIEKNPTMAEFWCLLGDINYELKKYKKAYFFYENARWLGEHRSNNDDLPVEINKYKEYPEKMKKICKELIDKI